MKHKCLRHPAVYGSQDPGWNHDESPCMCDCKCCLELKRIQNLPNITDDEMQNVWEMLEGCTEGPWVSAQIKGFGPERFIISQSQLAQWFNIIAELKNPGNIYADEFIAWCRDGVPKLLKRIKQLEDELSKKT